MKTLLLILGIVGYGLPLLAYLSGLIGYYCNIDAIENLYAKYGKQIIGVSCVLLVIGLISFIFAAPLVFA